MKTIILTGANRGLGKAIHDLLISKEYDGHDKIFTSRVKNLNKANIDSKADYLEVDLSHDFIDCSRINIKPDTKQIIFINNAGVIEPIDQAIKIHISSIKQAMNINFVSPLQLIKHLALEAHQIKSSFLIVNISSGAANRPIKGWISYCSGKAAIKMAIDVMVEENKNIDVIHFDPGVMDTNMQEVIRSKTKFEMAEVDVFKGFKDSDLLKKPVDVAKDVLALIGINDENSCII